MLGSMRCPKQYDDFGIHNLQLMGFALRHCMLWFARVDFDKTWSGMLFGLIGHLKSFSMLRLLC